jgi:hypothetical protein
MHPMLALFLRLTAVVGIAIVVLVIAGFLFKIAIVAALIAAVLVGGYFIYNLFRKRSNLPTR